MSLATKLSDYTTTVPANNGIYQLLIPDSCLQVIEGNGGELSTTYRRIWRVELESVARFGHHGAKYVSRLHLTHYSPLMI